MDVKVAVASSDGQTVNEHFGRSRTFRIYRLHDSGKELLEIRDNNPACSGHTHSEDAMKRAVGTIADCRGIVAAQIGPGAIDALLGKRIMGFTMNGSITEALNALQSSKRFAYLQ